MFLSLLSIRNPRLLIREFTNVRPVDRVGEQGGHLVVEKHFESPEKAVGFKKSYEKSQYEKEPVYVQLLRSSVMNDGPAKKKPGRPKKE